MCRYPQRLKTSAEANQQDRNNIGYARLMGLQEDLSLSSNQFYNAVMIFCTLVLSELIRQKTRVLMTFRCWISCDLFASQLAPSSVRPKDSIELRSIGFRYIRLLRMCGSRKCRHPWPPLRNWRSRSIASELSPLPSHVVWKERIRQKSRYDKELRSHSCLR